MRKMIIKYADDEVRASRQDGGRLTRRTLTPSRTHPASPRCSAADGERERRVCLTASATGRFSVTSEQRLTVSVTEMPFKQQHYVTLLMHLSYRLPEGEGDVDEDAQMGEKRKAEENEADCGREVLEDLGRAFRTSVEGREWLNARLLVSSAAL